MDKDLIAARYAGDDYVEPGTEPAGGNHQGAWLLLLAGGLICVLAGAAVALMLS